MRITNAFGDVLTKRDGSAIFPASAIAQPDRRGMVSYRRRIPSSITRRSLTSAQGAGESFVSQFAR
jgi:hypothetical protein